VEDLREDRTKFSVKNEQPAKAKERGKGSCRGGRGPIEA